MYNETITFYSKTPPNKGIMQDYSVTHMEENSICGDDLDIYLKIENNQVVDYSFDGETAIITTACASIFWEAIIWESIEGVLQMQYSFIEELVGMEISPRRRQASVLGLLSTRNAIHQYLKDGIEDEFDDVM